MTVSPKYFLSPTTHRIIFIVVSLFLSILLESCGGGGEYSSRWRTRDITIDGINTEWTDSLNVLDDKKVSFGLFNDDEYLYIGIITTDRGIARQIRGRGLTLWFDREGGNSKKFGIHYPLGIAGSFQRNGEGADSEAGITESRRERFNEVTDELEILGPGENDRHQMTLAEAGGIQAKMHASQDFDSLLYEIRIPLTDNAHPFAIGALAGSSIGVGIDTKGNGQSMRPREETGEGGGGGGAGMGGRRGGGGRYGGGRRGGGGERAVGGAQVEPIDVWTTVKLAGKGSQTQ